MFMPTHYKIVSGQGTSEHELLAFDAALRNAGIGDYNLVKVSSILPPHAEYSDDIPSEFGAILYAAYATITVNGERDAQSSVAVAIPLNSNDSGVIFECSLVDSSGADVMAEKMCIDAMRERKKSYVQIKKAVQSITGIENVFTCAIAAVVMW
jgi:arginine decarboxylase